MEATGLRAALRALADALADRGTSAHIAIVGGGALLLREGLQRPTQDVDIVAAAIDHEPLRPHHQLPPVLRDAALDVARVRGMDEDWLNTGALGVVAHLLPHGYEQRLRTESFGSGLLVSVLSRQDLLRLKLFAAHDEGPLGVHADDVRAMRPTHLELEDAATWVLDRFPAGPQPGWAELMSHLRRAIDG